MVLENEKGIGVTEMVPRDSSSRTTLWRGTMEKLGEPVQLLYVHTHRCVDEVFDRNQQSPWALPCERKSYVGRACVANSLATPRVRFQGLGNELGVNVTGELYS